MKQSKHFATRAMKVGVSACSHVEAFSCAEFKDGATDVAASEQGKRERGKETER